MAQLPRLSDLLTSANLCCGVLSALAAVHGHIELACWLIFIAALFDVFDGLAARAFGGGSEFGKQLDSLADMVSFGVAPGFLVHQEIGYWFTQHFAEAGQGFPWGHLPAALISLVIPVAAAWRLAKFNIDPRQTQGFLGLPSPANALFWAGLILGWDRFWTLDDWHSVLWLLTVLVIVLSALMLVEVPLPSLKLKQVGWHSNEVMWSLAGSGVLLFVLVGMLAVPAVLVLYLLSPLWGRVWR